MFRTRRTSRFATVSILAVAVPVVMSGAAGASVAVDDSFSVATLLGGCGAVDFVDNGPGAPGGGNNDDYLVIHDYCSDGYGVWGIAYRNGVKLGERYNSNGLAGAPLIYDPYTHAGNTNIGPGDTVRIDVCLADGSTSEWRFRCNSRTEESVDG